MLIKLYSFRLIVQLVMKKKEKVAKITFEAVRSYFTIRLSDT